MINKASGDEEAPMPDPQNNGEKHIGHEEKSFASNVSSFRSITFTEEVFMESQVFFSRENSNEIQAQNSCSFLNRQMVSNSVIPPKIASFSSCVELCGKIDTILKEKELMIHDIHVKSEELFKHFEIQPEEVFEELLNSPLDIFLVERILMSGVSKQPDSTRPSSITNSKPQESLVDEHEKFLFLLKNEDLLSVIRDHYIDITAPIGLVILLKRIDVLAELHKYSHQLVSFCLSFLESQILPQKLINEKVIEDFCHQVRLHKQNVLSIVEVEFQNYLSSKSKRKPNTLPERAVEVLKVYY